MRRTLVASAGLIVIAALPGRAQQIWSSPIDENGISVAVTHMFAEANPFGASSGVVDLGARFKVSPTVAATFGLPISHVDLNTSANPFYTGPTSSTRAGNPWLGVSVTSSPEVTLSAGFRVGLGDNSDLDEAASVAEGHGLLADYDHLEAWSGSQRSIRILAQLGQIPARGWFGTGLVGGTAVFAKDGNDAVDLVDYGFRMGVRGRAAMATASLTGRILVWHLGEGASFEDRMINQVALSVEAMQGGFRPNASLRIYLDPSIRSDSPDGSGIHGMVTVGAMIGLK